MKFSDGLKLQNWAGRSNGTVSPETHAKSLAKWDTQGTSHQERREYKILGRLRAKGIVQGMLAA